MNLNSLSADGFSGNDAGDPYTGWDRFGRTQELRRSKADGTVLDQTTYGYDCSSQRTWRGAPVAPRRITLTTDEGPRYSC